MNYSHLVYAVLMVTTGFYLGYQVHQPSESQQDFSSKSLEDIKKSINSETLFDAVFYYKAEIDSATIPAQIIPFRINEVFYGSQDKYIESTNLYLASFGTKGSGFSPAKSYAESLQLAQREGSRLNLSQKLLYLSLMGSKLASGYSSTTVNETDMEKVYQNAIQGKHQGGICGDIHRYLADHARALGFDGVGTHTGLWQKDKKGKDGGGHFIYHFRDPESGVYFVQNYSQLINTGQTNMQAAIDVSTRILAPISGVSQVESSSRANKYHAYLPQTSRWVQAHLKGFAEMKEDDPLLKLEISNEGKTVGLQFTKDMGNQNGLRGFFVHSDFKTSEGTFEMNAMGLANQTQFSRQLTDRLIDEYGALANTYGGVMNLTAPSYNQYGDPMDKSRSVLFMGAKVRGYARINKTTGRIEIEAFTNDFGLDDKAGKIDPRLRVGAEQKIKNSPWKVDAEREFEMSRTNQDSVNANIQTHYDRISLIYDNTRAGAKAFLVMNTEYYIFEGVEEYAASAVRQIIKASYPTAVLGTISVAVDASQMIDNRSKDLFYEHPFSASLRLAIEKSVTKFISVGGQIEYGKGRPYWKMDPNVTPQIQRSNKLSGFIWIHSKI